MQRSDAISPVDRPSPLRSGGGGRAQRDAASATERFLRGQVAAARDAGIELHCGTDFDAFHRTCRATEGKSDPYPIFQPGRWSHPTVQAGIWLEGRAQGRVVHLSAVRKFDLAGRCLAAAFPRWPHLYRAPPPDLGRDVEYRCRAPQAEEMFGTVCYLGEVWHSPDHRGRGLSAVIPPIALALAALRWRPDWVVAVVEPWVQRRGIARQYGLPHAEPALIVARSERGARLSLDWLAWIGAAELTDWMAADADSSRKP